MSDAFLGIDLGTSSVKAVLVRDGIVTERSSAPYPRQDCDGMYEGLKAALFQISSKMDICGVSLSSQTGTYIVNHQHMIPWNSAEGIEEMKEIREKYPSERFLCEIGMNHPPLYSFPLPRLLYSKRKYKTITSFCQLKDLICEKLTGNNVSEPYTWRGLSHAEKCTYSSFFLQELGVDEQILPKLITPQSAAGNITRKGSKETGLPEGIPVFVGLNDFFAALFGMGMTKKGDWFDISGSSEHLGRIEEGVLENSSLISCPYLTGCIHYGVTASTGAALEFGRTVFPEITENRLSEKLIRESPIFLPYLKGRRSPNPIPGASGSFHGIRDMCRSEHMAYAVLEGVVFSLYHIYETILQESDSALQPGKITLPGGTSSPREKHPGIVRLCGGSSVNPVLNRLKAELFDREIHLMKDKDASAFGAALTAMIGAGMLSGTEEAAGLCRTGEVIEPEGGMRELLLERYRKYLECTRYAEYMKEGD